MQTIHNFGAHVDFKLGEHGLRYDAIVDNVKIVKRVIGETETTLIYYDIDVFYEKEFGLHSIIRDVHSAFVLVKDSH